MASRLVLVLGDLFIPDRAIVSNIFQQFHRLARLTINDRIYLRKYAELSSMEMECGKLQALTR